MNLYIVYLLDMAEAIIADINMNDHIAGGNFTQIGEMNYTNNIFGIRFYMSNGQRRFIVYMIGRIDGFICITSNDFFNAYNSGQFV